MHNFINKEILNWSAFYKVKVEQSKNERLKSFYRVGMYNDETKLSDIDFVALDFETTGLDSEQNSIISIGLVPFNLKRIFCRQAKHWYIEPEDKLKENSIIIHGITKLYYEIIILWCILHFPGFPCFLRSQFRKSTVC